MCVYHIAAWTQNKIEMLLKQLGECYSQRDELWIAMLDDINKYGETGESTEKLHAKAYFFIPVDPVAELLKKTPANIERAISGLDKVRTRAVEKEEGNSTVYSEQMLKSLLKGF